MCSPTDCFPILFIIEYRFGKFGLVHFILVLERPGHGLALYIATVGLGIPVPNQNYRVAASYTNFHCLQAYYCIWIITWDAHLAHRCPAVAAPPSSHRTPLANYEMIEFNSPFFIVVVISHANQDRLFDILIF